MGRDHGQAPDQHEPQTRRIGAQDALHQRLRIDQNTVGAIPVEQAERRDAHGLRWRGGKKAGVTGLIILMEPRGCRRLRSTPCLNRSKRPFQWPDLAEEQRDALRPL